MTIHDVVKHINRLGYASKEDLANLRYELKKGVLTPFFKRYMKSSYVSIRRVLKINKMYALVLFDDADKNPVSVDTIKSMVRYQTKDLKHISRTSYSTDFISKNQTSFALLKYELIDMIPLLSQVDRLRETKDNLMIAIDGYAASGKTTLAQMLSEVYHANVFHIDDFFKKMDANLNDPLSVHGNNIDFIKINETIIAPLVKQEAVSYRLFDFKKHQHTDLVTVGYKSMNIIEGAYSMHPSLKVTYDFKIFLSVCTFKEWGRVYQRNGLKRLLIYIKKWIPKERRYFKTMHIREQADLIIKK